MRQDRLILGLALGAVAVILFAASLPTTRLAVAALDPWFVTAARGALAGLVAAVVLAHSAASSSVARSAAPGDDRALPGRRLSRPDGGLDDDRPLGAWRRRARPAADRDCCCRGLRSPASGPRSSSGRCRSSAPDLSSPFPCRDGGFVPLVGDLLLFVSVAICGTGYALAGSLSRRMPGWEVISWASVVACRCSCPATFLLWPRRRRRCSLAGLERRSLPRSGQPVSRVLALEQRAGDRRRRAHRPGAAAAALRDAGRSPTVLLGEAIDLRTVRLRGGRRRGRCARPQGACRHRAAALQQPARSNSSGAEHGERRIGPLGFLDRPRRHVHRRRRARSRQAGCTRQSFSPRIPEAYRDAAVEAIRRFLGVAPGAPISRRRRSAR